MNHPDRQLRWLTLFSDARCPPFLPQGIPTLKGRMEEDDSGLTLRDLKLLFHGEGDEVLSKVKCTIFLQSRKYHPVFHTLQDKAHPQLTQPH